MPTKKTDEPVHELKDLEVQEVSLVDHPANKRPFLIVKAEEASVPEPKKTKKDDEPAAAPAIPDEQDEYEEIELGNMTLPEELAKALGSKLDRAAKRLSALATAVETADKSADGEVPPAMLRQITAIARTLAGISGASDDDSTADAQKDDEPAPEVDAFKAVADEIEKAGRKLSQSRLKQLKQIVEMASKLLAEVDEGEPDTSATTKAANDKFATIEKQLADAAAAVEKITGVVDNQQKIIKSQSDEIKRLKGSHPAPNSSIPEGESDAVKKSFWPSNFNEPEIPADLQF